jgi:4-aminobutyrate aminotransferase-like enzyme/Ser/Thr protein kinase RdoA (MazF antagonist)
MDYQELKISPNKAEKVLFELYGIEGSANELPGEIDFNFRITVENNESYVLKISRPGDDPGNLDFQIHLLNFINSTSSDIAAPVVIKDRKGDYLSGFLDDTGSNRTVRLYSWVPGRLWSLVNPQLDDLRYDLGNYCGNLTQSLSGFEHEGAFRYFEWDIAQSSWTREYLHLFTDQDREILTFFLDRFERSKEAYKKLRKGIVHNDVNDNNVIVSSDLRTPLVKAVIDFGDAIHTQIINDLAVVCAYAIMGQPDPLAASLPVVSGYHSSFPLEASELEHLYDSIAMRLIISVTRSAINKEREPSNNYLTISEKPAWDLLRKWYTVHPDFACFSFREACGFNAHPNQERFAEWASKNTFTLSELFPSVNRTEVFPIDLSVSSKWIGHLKEINDLELFGCKIDQLQRQHPDKIIAGGYLEPRSLYTTSAYEKKGNSGFESRTIHLGIDYWLPKGTAIHAPLDGEVVIAVNDSGEKEYGGLVVLSHSTGSFDFYSLYGHLSVASATRHQAGDLIEKGKHIGDLGDYTENGNWSPHLHFQIILSLFDQKDDFPGVAYHGQIDVWKSICPDPNLLFGSPPLQNIEYKSDEELISFRRKHLGKGLSLHYDVPVRMVRGDGAYLLNQHGRRYLDTVNNVAHVGHENYDVVKAGQQQMALLNTNSRYLHDMINELAEELIETLPAELNVLHFVNSGSEANELAIRMAKTHTKQRNFIVSEHGYHGNTNMCVDISSYKFDGKGGKGAPENTYVIPMPYTFRGKHRGADAAIKYAKEVSKQINAIHLKKSGLAGFIIEPIISCGGQVELPEGFLKEAYRLVREAGGICISDEVQTGCGRMGSKFWGFQLYDVIPDIVTIGKPLGNGHPVAAVACTREIAESFANGMEYFNTFGGNPVSCTIGAEVLRVVKKEQLQKNALEVGSCLKEELWSISNDFPIIGEVRGHGLFLGIELVDEELNPLAEHTNYLANRMKDHGILMSIDGPDHNVLKIKPPLVFSRDHSKILTDHLRKILAEDFMKYY